MQAARGVDLILVQDTVSTGFPAALASLLTRKKLVVRVPGDYAWEQGVQRFGVKESLEDFQKHPYGLIVGVLRAVQRFVVRRAHRVIVPSEYLGRIVTAWMPSSKSVDVIYNGVERTNIASPKRTSNLIVSSGRLVPWKGFAELIDIVGEHTDWRLEILGDGPLRLELEDHSWAMSAHERVTFRGSVPHDEAASVFSRAAVFVLNSRYEGLSHTLIEAMSVGTPVIATRAGGNPEVIKDGVSGLLVDVGDTEELTEALGKVLTDEGLRTKLGAAAAERAKDFSIEKTIEATATLLRSCVS
jgi:glycosyltransferase involved in cell wall biosynthesis